MNIAQQSVELIDYMGSDLSVVNAARVSFQKESDWDIDTIQGAEPHIYENVKVLSEQDQKLIRYLATHNHWTPFAHAFLSFRIKAPIFVARQLVKHQVGLAWNEVSRRYVDDEPEFYFPPIWRKRAENVKQGSSDEPVDDWSVDWAHGEALYPETLTKAALRTYTEMLFAGVAPEQARMVLPQNTMTEWVWSGSLAAFARVVSLRIDPHAQKETQEVAWHINALVPTEFTHSWKALVGI
jgi:thymidylate synthase (FAD)